MKVTVVNTLAPYQSQTVSDVYGMTHLIEDQKMLVFQQMVTESGEETIVEHQFPDKYLFMIET